MVASTRHLCLWQYAVNPVFLPSVLPIMCPYTPCFLPTGHRWAGGAQLLALPLPLLSHPLDSPVNSSHMTFQRPRMGWFVKGCVSVVIITKLKTMLLSNGAREALFTENQLLFVNWTRENLLPCFQELTRGRNGVSLGLSS